MRERCASIERLRAGEGDRWRSIRLRALQEAPHAFGTTYAEASAWPSDRWERQVAEVATFVAMIDVADVGAARGSVHPTRGDVRELISMWVAPSARRKGIGSSLIDAVADWASAQGAAALVLDVMEDNRSAIALYGSRGFEIVTDDSLGERAAGEVRMASRTAANTR
jgi:ribosomal protein S18 acetylase RimI-like enzyme